MGLYPNLFLFPPLTFLHAQGLAAGVGVVAVEMEKGGRG